MVGGEDPIYLSILSHCRIDLCLIYTMKSKVIWSSEINRSVRPGSLKTGTDGLPQSVLGPDGDGASFCMRTGTVK